MEIQRPVGSTNRHLGYVAPHILGAENHIVEPNTMPLLNPVQTRADPFSGVGEFAVSHLVCILEGDQRRIESLFRHIQTHIIQIVHNLLVL